MLVTNRSALALVFRTSFSSLVSALVAGVILSAVSNKATYSLTPRAGAR
jgi:hypothetical protein